MNWVNDEVFFGEGEDRHNRLGLWSTPAFRLCMQSSLGQAHPFDFVEEYEALFQVFEPVLRRDAERLLVQNTKSGQFRRRKSINNTDWTPFEYLNISVANEFRTFVGFEFQSGRRAKDVFDAGPTCFRMSVDATNWLDATIPVDDFIGGALDIDALKAALLSIPTRSAVAGFGLCMSEDINRWAPRSTAYAAMPVARKFPALDIAYVCNRGWVHGNENKSSRIWHLGINWLTMIGEPYIGTLGGIKKITGGLDSSIKVDVGNEVVLFQLGDRPITGQEGIDDDLLYLYEELGERLKPIGENAPSNKNCRPIFGNGFDEQSVAWERRFYDHKKFVGTI